MSTKNKADYPWEITREVERLQKQHTWVQRCLDNKIVFAPMTLDKEGLKILDVGCANGNTQTVKEINLINRKIRSSASGPEEAGFSICSARWR